jgi:hypothetical protein
MVGALGGEEFGFRARMRICALLAELARGTNCVSQTFC